MIFSWKNKKRTRRIQQRVPSVFRQEVMAGFQSGDWLLHLRPHEEDGAGAVFTNQVEEGAVEIHYSRFLMSD